MDGLNHLPYFITNIVIFSKYSNVSSILLKWGKYGFLSIIIPHNRPESLRLSAAVQNNLQPDLRHQTPDWAVLGWCPSPLVWWCRALTRRSAMWWVSTPSTPSTQHSSPTASAHLAIICNIAITETTCTCFRHLATTWPPIVWSCDQWRFFMEYSWLQF